MSPILVTLTSRSDSEFERSNVSLKENKPDGVNPNSNNIDYYVRGKIRWFSADCVVLIHVSPHSRRQLYDAQEKYENQLTETMQHLEQERSKRLEAATKSQNVEENIDDLKRDHNRKIEQMETNLRQQSDRIKELTDLVSLYSKSWLLICLIGTATYNASPSLRN